MDQAGMKNVRIVLYTTVVLTLATFGVLLVMTYQGKDVPDLLIGITTTLLGILTGSTVSLSAKPSVSKRDAPAVVASGSPVSVDVDTGGGDSEAALLGVSTVELNDDAVPLVETDGPDLDGDGLPDPVFPEK